jgi:4'-phosphopantetheinyl transferase EntD
VAAADDDRRDEEPAVERLRVALSAMAPAGVSVGVRRIAAADLAALHPAEAAAIERAVPRRRHEFATGRALLRDLLGEDVTIVPGPDRAPVLPPGVRGSLAHDRTFAVAALTPLASVAALGVDVEPATPLAADVAAIVLRADERGLDAHLAFTLKEAAYKAWSRLGGRILEHHDVALALDGDRFEAHVVADAVTLTGAWRAVGGRFVALVVVPAPAS